MCDVELLKDVLLKFGDECWNWCIRRNTRPFEHVRWSHTRRSAYRGHNFGYLNDVCGGDIEVISFQQEQLAIADEEVVTPLSMERM